MSHEPYPIESRFWPKVNKTETCWLWTASTNGRYGTFGRGRKGEGMVYAHRLAWELAHGPIPPGMDVCHTCDTPLCVRPEHLFLGTRQDNMRDMMAKGRRAAAERTRHLGESNGRAKLSDAAVAALRADRDTGAIYAELASKYGIGMTQVARLVHRQQRA